MKKFLGFFVAVLMTTFVQNLQASEKGINIYAYSRSLPSKTLLDERGRKITLQDMKGDFVLAVFWSRHCIPCIRELKDLNDFANKTKNDGIRVILVSDKKEWQGGFSEQKRMLHRFGGDDLEAYVDNRGDLAAAFGIFSSPVTILISRDSKEIGRIRGSVKWAEDEVVEYMYRLKAEHG